MQFIESSDFVGDAVDVIVSALSGESNRPHRISLCGGTTPEPVYRALAEANLDWSNIEITFGDERCVPPDHDDSNFRMASGSLLSKVPLNGENVLRMRGELDPVDAAIEYENSLRQRSGTKIYRHDLILLGMGEDGHIASLFPGTSAINENDRWVVSNHVPQKGESRITFTYPIINAARKILFLIKGQEKRSVVDRVLSGQSDLPVSLVDPDEGAVTWLLG
ncbi:MAG: 6-phosphogluconolactonase [Verrucomicrobiales bacterium]|nr:6-phosphogluconolactonase [Verrucomicrobiales bacterium]MEC7358002.1 6-phosphogluconolactonase [Verrucomicrobiota bacterium]